MLTAENGTTTGTEGSNEHHHRSHPVTIVSGASPARRVFEVYGFVAGAILILCGAAAIFMGYESRTTIRDSRAAGKIVGGEDISSAAITKAFD